ncbi:hypothetical protein BT69DRAFT_1028134 [Atractiella rhizophila]|nr:hypothetical protein BT69DRAFT_1028134 [Atractiella rhizophila]
MMMERQTSSARQGSQAPDSMALVHAITPGYRSSIHVSILPSFLSRLPLSIHTLRISYILPRRMDEYWEPGQVSSKLSYLSLERVKHAVNKDGAISLHISIDSESVSVTVLDVGGHASAVNRDVKSEVDPFAASGDSYTHTLLFLRENGIFAPLLRTPNMWNASSPSVKTNHYPSHLSRPLASSKSLSHLQLRFHAPSRVCL